MKQFSAVYIHLMYNNLMPQSLVPGFELYSFLQQGLSIGIFSKKPTCLVHHALLFDKYYSINKLFAWSLKRPTCFVHALLQDRYVTAEEIRCVYDDI